MSIPLYFATNCKESVTLSGAKALPIGCGMTKSGELRLPSVLWSGGPLLIDDAFSVIPTEDSLKKLRTLCQNGCILDFERPPNSYQQLLIQKMKEWKISPLWLPERFNTYDTNATVIISNNLPHNSWRQYCISLQRKYPNRWALELQPIQWEKTLPIKQKEQNFFLQEAVCMCKIHNHTVTYYDSKQTLQKKLQIAAEHGCRGIIALWSEWQDKGMAQP